MESEFDLDDKDPTAVEGFKVALNATDVMLEGLLDIARYKALDLDEKKHRGVNPLNLIGPLMRLTVQKQLIEVLREELPLVLVNGDQKALHRIISILG